MNNLIFISDLDGTLLSHGSTVCEQSIQTIRDAKDDVTFCIATGRHIGEVTKDLDLQKDAKYIITSNGNEIYEVENGETLRKIYTGAAITSSIAEQVISIAKKYEAYHIISTSDTYYCENKDLLLTETEKKYGIYHEEIESVLAYIQEKDSNVLKMIFFLRPNELKKLQKELKENLGHLTDITTSSPMSIEVNMKGVTKGNAIAFLKQHIQATEDTIFACVGDNGNDLSMVEPCHYSFAMHNGIDELKAVATETVPSVGHALRRLMDLVPVIAK